MCAYKRSRQHRLEIEKKPYFEMENPSKLRTERKDDSFGCLPTSWKMYTNNVNQHCAGLLTDILPRLNGNHMQARECKNPNYYAGCFPTAFVPLYSQSDKT